MREETLNNLKNALRAYDREGCVAWVEKALAAGVDPLKAINALTEVMQEVGDGFTRGDFFLPDLIASGSTMEAAMTILNAELIKRGLQRASLGTVVIGTVFGDIHSIGKDMVGTLLTAAGFTVHDLGINVKAEEFVAAIEEHHPDILAMSALLTTTAKEQNVVIEALKTGGLRERIRVMVGGGAIDESFAHGIGADGYAPTAPEAVLLAKSLIEE